MKKLNSSLGLNKDNEVYMWLALVYMIQRRYYSLVKAELLRQHASFHGNPAQKKKKKLHNLKKGKARTKTPPSNQN